MAEQQTILNNRYVMKKKLAEGGMGVVYHAIDKLSGESVALKQVRLDALELSALSSSADSLTVRRALAQEFRTLASLRHPNIISVLDYGFYEDENPFFTMDYLANLVEFRDGGMDFDIVMKIELLIQLLQALAYLHRRGVLHRDIKPGNVAIDDGIVKVLDFGLSVDREELTSSLEIAGTLAYMSPEVLQGELPTTSSDLYAVGIMAYELFTGKYPFNLNNTGQLVMDIISTEPNYSELDELDIDSTPMYQSREIAPDAPTVIMGAKAGVAIDDDSMTNLSFDIDPNISPISRIVRRLISKSVEDRYQQAYDVIYDLSAVIGQPLPKESKLIQDSFLQAAKFVGRDAELAKLQEALGDAIASHGSAWLVGGETGVGKTRLLDELRVHALIEGMITIRGQAITENSLPYQVWREPVRRMMIYSEVDEVDASILRDLVHDIERLLNREVNVADSLDASKYQERLQESILSLFKDIKTPILLILEDVQWAQDSLDILKRLCNMIADLPILIVASYRQDEAPNLSHDLQELDPIHLDRLNRSSIELLSSSILGEVGSHPEVIDLLQRETEGNVYFIVEVVRALAEEVGSLHAINTTSIPTQITAGGMERILQRRLSRISDSSQRLLQLSAIVGRELDLKLIDLLKADADVDFWFVECSNAGVIELSDDAIWRFAHDRIRRTVLEALDDATERSHHAEVAQAIETLYGNQPEQSYILAKHWRDANNFAKELKYVQAAAEYALHIGNLTDAKEFFERTLELLNQSDDQSNIAANRANVRVSLGKTLHYLGENEAALEHILSAEHYFRETTNQEGIAKTLIERGNIVKRLGNLSEADEVTKEALELYSRVKNKRGMAHAMDRMGDIRYEQGDYENASLYTESGLKIAQELDDRNVIGSLLNNIGMIAFAQGDYQKADENFSQAEEIYRSSGQRRALATLQLNRGSVAGQQDDLDTCHDYFKKALEVFQAIGEKRLMGITYRNLGLVASMQGNYELATWYYEETLKISESIGNIREMAYALISLGELAVNLDQIPRALSLYNNAMQQSYHIEALPIALDAIAKIAPLLSDKVLGAQIIGHVLSHSATSQETRNLATAISEDLSNLMPPHTYASLLKRGEELITVDLVQVIIDLLSDEEGG